ncbi:pyridoxamine 5'-phosphate oxidase family protein [Brachybacterium sacelli]|uniref:pyridoxamine 5'-phosphate oxidase family protein n=1 Tax=Brachybacterium sacelli TaxID=173364 RepID=UPI003615CE4A
MLALPLFAHLATASKEGPRDSPLWFLWEAGSIWTLGNYDGDSFPRRVEADGRCAVGIVDFDVATGRVLHVGFRGHAVLTPQEPGRVRRLLRRYLGPDESGWDSRFTGILGDESWVLLRFDPVTAVVRDQSYQLGAPQPRGTGPEVATGRPVPR